MYCPFLDIAERICVGVAAYEQRAAGYAPELVESVEAGGEAGVVLYEPGVGKARYRAVRGEHLQRRLDVIAHVVVLPEAYGIALLGERVDNAVAPDDLPAAAQRQHQRQYQREGQRPLQQLQEPHPFRKIARAGGTRNYDTLI